MSDDKSLRKNFLKISIFNLEQSIKNRAANRVKEIDTIGVNITKLEQELNELGFTSKDVQSTNLQKYKSILTLIRTNEIELYNYIDYYYKFGNHPVAEFISDGKDKTIQVDAKRSKTTAAIKTKPVKVTTTKTKTKTPRITKKKIE